MCDPIGIWSDKNIIVEGHGRYLALKKLGKTEAPCIRLDHLNELERREYALAHNKTAEMSEWDDEMLEAELKAIKQELDEMDIDFDMSDFGFDLSEFDLEEESDSEEEREVEEDEAPEVDEENEPITKLGDVWQLGKHRLMCGDSTDRATVEKLMDGKKADMVFTDPPFGNDLGYGRGQLGERFIKNDEDTKVLENIFSPIDYALKNNTHCLVWIQWRTFSVLEKTFEKYRLRTVVIWDKKQAGLSGGGFAEQYEMCCVFIKGKATQAEYSGNVWQCAREHDKRSESEHPHKKPIEILARGLRLCSKSGNLVLDLFGGSGSTLIACEQLGRTCYMMELDPKYCDVIIKRWENLTGKKAKLVKSK